MGTPLRLTLAPARRFGGAHGEGQPFDRPPSAEESAMTETTTTFPSDPAAYNVGWFRDPFRDRALTHIGVFLRCAETGGYAETLAQYRGDDVPRIIRLAREEERTDPHSDKLPSDRAVILAALREAGIDPEESGDDASPAPVADGSPAYVTGDGKGGWKTAPAGMAVAPSCLPPPARDPQERRVMPALEDESEEEEQDARDVLERLAEAQLGLSGIGEVVDDASIQAIADAYDEIASLRAVLDEAIQAWPAYDADPADDCEINGGDMVEWFGTWRAHAKAARTAIAAWGRPYA
jgi:hypothetical protein